MLLMQYFTIYGHTEITVMDTYLYTFRIFVGFPFLIFIYTCFLYTINVSYFYVRDVNCRSLWYSCRTVGWPVCKINVDCNLNSHQSFWQSFDNPNIQSSGISFLFILYELKLFVKNLNKYWISLEMCRTLTILSLHYRSAKDPGPWQAIASLFPAFNWKPQILR